MSELTAGLEPAERRRGLAVVYLLVSAPAWQAMRTQFGLDGVGLKTSLMRLPVEVHRGAVYIDTSTVG